MHITIGNGGADGDYEFIEDGKCAPKQPVYQPQTCTTLNEGPGSGCKDDKPCLCYSSQVSKHVWFLLSSRLLMHACLIPCATIDSCLLLVLLVLWLYARAPLSECSHPGACTASQPMGMAGWSC